MNIPKIVNLMQEAAKWRLEHETSSVIAKWESDNSPAAKLLKAYWPIGHIGRDFKGRTINIHLLSGVDILSMTKEVGSEMIFSYSFYLMERNIW